MRAIVVSFGDQPPRGGIGQRFGISTGLPDIDKIQTPPRPGPARGLVALAVRLLPAGQRPRYREEFGVELVELQRRQQRKYALRVLVSAGQLRCALIEAAHTGASEPSRRVRR